MGLVSTGSPILMAYFLSPFSRTTTSLVAFSSPVLTLVSSTNEPAESRPSEAAIVFIRLASATITLGLAIRQLTPSLVTSTSPPSTPLISMASTSSTAKVKRLLSPKLRGVVR